MIDLLENTLLSDAERDRHRFHSVLQALEEANAHLGWPAASARDIDQVLDRLLPKVAQALKAEQAFVAVMRTGENDDRWFEITVTYPPAVPRGGRIPWSPWLAGLVGTGVPLERVPLDPASSKPIPELDPICTVSALVVRMEGLGATRLVGLCGSSAPDADVFLAEDLKTFKSIVDLLAVGWRVGEKRSRELESIQRSLAVVSAELNPDRVSALVVKEAVKLFDGAPVSLMLWDRRAPDTLKMVEAGGLSAYYQEHVTISRRHVEAFRGPDGTFTPGLFDLLRNPLADPALVRQEGLCWALSSPLQTSAGLIGVLNIYSRDPHHTFSPADMHLAQIVAHQVAIAVQNAQLYHEKELQTRHWQALHKSSLALAEGITVDRRDLLQRIAQQAVESLTGINPPKAKVGVIRLVNPEGAELCLECVYPSERWQDVLGRAGECRSLDPAQVPDGRIGVGGRAVNTGKAQLVRDVREDPDYMRFSADTRSELDVPLMQGGRAIGVLSVESNDLAAFDENDQAVLEGLAAMAVVVYQNSELAEQLELNTEVASMGAWGAEIMHDTRQPLQHLQQRVKLLLEQRDLPDALRTELERLGQDAEELRGLDLGTLPSRDSGRVCSVPEMIRAEVTEAQRVNPKIAWRVWDVPDVDMRIEPQWGRRLLRHLLKNAIQHGLKGVPHPLIQVSARVENGKAYISVTNNGPQVPEHEQKLLFRARLSDEAGRRRGLLIVRFVAKKCGGGANLVRSDATGTCFEFYIPVSEESQRRAL